VEVSEAVWTGKPYMRDLDQMNVNSGGRKTIGAQPSTLQSFHERFKTLGTSNNGKLKNVQGASRFPSLLRVPEYYQDEASV